jgi:hypothetical protein
MNMKKEICPTPRIECIVAIPGNPCGIKEVLNKAEEVLSEVLKDLNRPTTSNATEKYVPIKQNASIDKTVESFAETKKKRTLRK